MLTAHTELPVAAYCQSVLAAFQEVEDNLAALRILDREARTQDEAVRSAEGSPALSNHRYKGGLVTYLEVITAQSTALADEQVAVNILTRRMIAKRAAHQGVGRRLGFFASPLAGVEAAPDSGDALGAGLDAIIAWRTMLKTTIERDPGIAALKLEGKLAGPWAHELEPSWRAVRTLGTSW